MGWLTKALSPEDPSAPFFPASWLGEIAGGNDAGVQLSELTSRCASGVLACVRVISEAAAAYPKEIYQRIPNGKRLAAEHPLYQIIHGPPNPQMTNFVFWVGIISQTCIWGNGYALIQRDQSNRVRALWPLPSSATTPQRDADGTLTYKVVTDGTEKEYSAANIIHLPFLSFDGVRGYSPIQLRRQGLSMNLAAERFGALFFGKGARPSGVLEVANAMKPEAKANLKQSMQEGMSGANALGIALMEPGVTFKPLTIDPTDAQFLETRKYQLEEVLRDYRVPAHMAGVLERATHSNAEQLGYDFSTYTMLAWVLMIEQELDRKLFTGSQFFCKLNMDVFLRGDFETRMAGYQVMRNAGVLHANNICSMEDWPLIPESEGGNVRIVPLNMVSLEQLKKQANEPSPSSPGTTLEGDGDGEDEPEEDNKALLRRRLAQGFTRLFQDAVGRTVNRDKKDVATVQRVWLPTLTALAESLASSGDSTELSADATAFLADYAGGIAQRCPDWKHEFTATIATAEYGRAFTALVERV